MDMHEEFYRNLKSFSDFSGITDNSHFHPVPDSWNVVLTDIKGSTKAIQAGRYKEVNMLGAACITCVANALGHTEFPFVFGGDGATMLIPDRDLDLVSQELLNLKALSEKDFGLELRLGLVPVSSLYQMGAELTVGKYQLSPGNYTAQFKGGGLTLAEDLIKNDQNGAKLLSLDGLRTPPNLEGLSCRIQPIDSKHGVILSLLVKPKLNQEKDKILGQVMETLRALLNSDFNQASPVSKDRLVWKWPPETIKFEALFLKGNRTFLAEFFSATLRSLIAWLLLNFNVNLAGFKPQTYKDELVLNSDFKKFDDILRMVIDCTEEQATSIEKYLAKMASESQVSYGTHRSSHALLTCMVKSASSNQHMHFVDGSNGGYALAALQMKTQK